MAIHIRVARSARELEAVYSVRARARFEQFGGKSAAIGGQLVDRFDTFGSSLNIVIMDGSVPIGAMRVSEESEVGLPGDALNDFRAIRGFLSGRILGIDNLCLLRQYRARPGILVAAIKVMIQVVRAREGRHLLILAPQELAPHLSDAGFSAIGPAEWFEEAQAYLTPLYGLVQNLRMASVEWIEMPELDSLGGSLHRSIYSEGELICQQGEPGECAFVVARGSVRLMAQAAEGAETTLDILGPGEVFGETGLLDGGPRLVTVRASAQETDLIVMERAVFKTSVFSDQTRIEALMRLLARPIRSRAVRQLGVPIQEAVGQLVRLLVDAARSQHIDRMGLIAGVTLAWLAGQLGQAPDRLMTLIDGLEQEGLLVWRPDGVWIPELERLAASLEELPGGSAGAAEHLEFTRTPLGGPDGLFPARVGRPALTRLS